MVLQYSIYQENKYLKTKSLCNSDTNKSVSLRCVRGNIQVWRSGSHTDLLAAHTPLPPRFHGCSHRWWTSCSGTCSGCSHHRGNPVAHSGRGRSRSQTVTAAVLCQYHCSDENQFTTAVKHQTGGVYMSTFTQVLYKFEIIYLSIFFSCTLSFYSTTL